MEENTPLDPQTPEASEQKPERKPTGLGENLYIWLQALVMALTFIVVVFIFCGRIIGVDGNSMVPTLHHGDMLLLQSIGYTPKAGDVVVLTQKSFSDTAIVKRVIATGGQTVDIDYATSTLYVDGVAIDEPYLGEAMVRPPVSSSDHIEVPEGSICVLGDNRNNSTDSRFASVGTVDSRSVLGRVLLILFPFSHTGVIR